MLPKKNVQNLNLIIQNFENKMPRDKVETTFPQNLVLLHLTVSKKAHTLWMHRGWVTDLPQQ